MTQNNCKKDIELILKESNLLFIKMEGREIEVHIKRCFPWSHPWEFLSLRDQDDNEVCLIENLEEQSQKTQDIIRRYLVNIDFVINIKEVIRIEEDVELRQYFVSTPGGERQFQTKIDEWPEIHSDGSILIQDLAGDLFKIDNFSALDKKSRKVLETYVA